MGQKAIVRAYFEKGTDRLSEPNTAMYKEDIQLNNQLYCQYLIALSQIGLGNFAKAKALFPEILDKNPNHQGALRHLAFVK